MREIEMMAWVRVQAAATMLLLASAVGGSAQLPILSDQEAPRLNEITSPVAEFGQELGSDYFLVNYTGLQGYWAKLAEESDRMVLDTLGPTEEGRPQLVAIITSPENHANLDRYREIARTLAKAEGVTEAEARALASEGKAIVWIDGGLHATEVLGAQQLMQLVYDMVSKTDPETMRFLDDIVLLAAHANPDGHELVADWYMRHDDPMMRSSSGVPVLYQKYAGHDNNRDFYMAALQETENMARAHYREWFPQIIYNHHQTGPQGTVMFAPPFRDPPNHNLDPMILTSLDQVGSAIHQRMVREGKGGTTMRSGASYSTWWNGGLRTTPYFHNMIGLLTETIGHPTPIEIPFIPRRQLPHGDLPLPVSPGAWHFKWSVDYSQTANRAVMDYASRNRDHLLFNIWQMGQNAIERGSRDHWTVKPAAIQAAAEELPTRPGRGGPTPIGSADDLRAAHAGPGAAGPARVHHSVRSVRLRNGHQVRERPAQVRCRRAPRHVRVHGGREPLPRGLIRREDGTGVPVPRARHVRASGPPQRLRLSGRGHRPRRTMSRGGPWPIRWVWSSTEFWRGSTAPSRPSSGWRRCPRGGWREPATGDTC